MSEELEFIQWLVPYLVLVIGLIIGGIITKNFVIQRFKFAITKHKMEDSKKNPMSSITGKIRMAIENTDLVYENISKEMKELEKLTHSSDKNVVTQAQARLKCKQQEMKVVEWIMSNKTAVDMVGETGLALIEGIESKARKIAKGGLKDYI